MHILDYFTDLGLVVDLGQKQVVNNISLGPLNWHRRWGFNLFEVESEAPVNTSGLQTLTGTFFFLYSESVLIKIIKPTSMTCIVLVLSSIYSLCFLLGAEDWAIFKLTLHLSYSSSLSLYGPSISFLVFLRLGNSSLPRGSASSLLHSTTHSTS